MALHATAIPPTSASALLHPATLLIPSPLIDSSLPRMIGPLDVSLLFLGPEVHGPQVACGVTLSLIVEMRRIRVTPFAACRDGSRTHLVTELHHCHEAVPAGAVIALGARPAVRAE